MVSRDITILNQKILIISIVVSVLLSQFANLLASQMFLDFYTKTTFAKLFLILIYILSMLFLCVFFIAGLFWIFNIKFKYMEFKRLKKGLFYCGLILLILIMVGIIKWIFLLTH
ncbi:MAG: hypothetical protein WC413_01570 [Candidatus Nanoarchaeia archaeon]